MKIRNVRFVRNSITRTRCELCYDDVTMTSFITPRALRFDDQRPTRRPTDLVFWKISNGHISATGHPIHFMFRSIVYGFRVRRIEWHYFRLEQIENVEWPYLCNGSCDSLCVLVLYDIEFSGRRIECLYFRLNQIQDRGRQPSCIILNGHLWNGSSDPIRIWFWGKSIGENNARGVIRLVTIQNISCRL